MYQKERLEEILKILKNTHYATIDYLVEQIHYSPATIRRDVTILEKQGLVKRSFGGVEIIDDNDTPFLFRQHKMKGAKNKIAKYAASLIKDGDTVFLDGSTTAQFMLQYILPKKDITVITNNLTLSCALAAEGIKVFCTGGAITETPGTASGLITANAFSHFMADIMFFSTEGIDENGIITVKPEGYFIHNKAMLSHSKKHVYLCSSNKIGKVSKIVQCDLSEIDVFVSDAPLLDKIKETYKKTEYIVV